jgi:hypothetical protein
MKKTLTIILLSISLSGFSQTEKGDWVVTPTVGWNTLKIDNTPERDVLGINFPVVFYKYLSDRFAIGYGLGVTYDSVKPHVVNFYERNVTVINFVPEARYNFLKTRFTPFVSGKILTVGYISQFIDNPAVAVDLRRITNLQLNEGLKIDVGVSYFIKDRFGLQVKLMDLNVGLFNRTDFKAYLPINFGLQFIINNPRPEIESPR